MLSLPTLVTLILVYASLTRMAHPLECREPNSIADTLFTPSSYESVIHTALHDVNDDGLLDVVLVARTASSSEFVRVYRCTGSTSSSAPSFSNAVRLSAPPLLSGQGVAVGLLAGGDLLPDIVAVGDGGVAVWENTTPSPGSSLTFLATPTLLDSGLTGGRTVALADLDADDAVDVLASSHAGVWVYKGLAVNGGGYAPPRLLFLPSSWSPVFSTIAAEITSIAVADMDGDGVNEIVFSDIMRQTWGWAFQNATSPGGDPEYSHDLVLSLAPAGSLPDPESPRQVIVAPLDADPLPDVVATYSAADNVRLFLNPGSGCNSSSCTIDDTGSVLQINNVFGPSAIGVGDVDGDGHLDIVVGQVNAFNDAILYLPGSSTGSFPDVVSLAHMGFARGIRVGDINGDGAPDVLIGDLQRDDAVVISGASNSLGATYQPSTPLVSTLDTPRKIVVADVSSDGSPDIIFVDNQNDFVAWIPRGISNPTLTFVSRQANGVEDMVVADGNGDGALDVYVAARVTDEVKYYVNLRGDGTLWSRGNIIRSFTLPYALEVVDIDVDQWPDVVYATCDQDAGHFAIEWMRNRGDGSYSDFPHQTPTGVIVAPGTPQVTECVEDMEIADVDGLGGWDIVAVVGNADLLLVIVADTSGPPGTYLAPVVVDNGVVLDDPRSLDLGDVDGDSLLDVVVSNGAGDAVNVWINTGASPNVFSGTGTELVSPTLVNSPRQTVIVDFDRDGQNDVLIGTTVSDEILFFRSTPGSPGSWDTPIQLASSVNAFTLAVMDWDGDGDLDVLYSDSVADSVNLVKANLGFSPYTPSKTVSGFDPVRCGYTVACIFNTIATLASSCAQTNTLTIPPGVYTGCPVLTHFVVPSFQTWVLQSGGDVVFDCASQQGASSRVMFSVSRGASLTLSGISIRGLDGTGLETSPFLVRGKGASLVLDRVSVEGCVGGGLTSGGLITSGPETSVTLTNTHVSQCVSSGGGGVVRVDMGLDESVADVSVNDASWTKRPTSVQITGGSATGLSAGLTTPGVASPGTITGGGVGGGVVAVVGAHDLSVVVADSCLIDSISTVLGGLIALSSVGLDTANSSPSSTVSVSLSDVRVANVTAAWGGVVSGVYNDASVLESSLASSVSSGGTGETDGNGGSGVGGGASPLLSIARGVLGRGASSGGVTYTARVDATTRVSFVSGRYGGLAFACDGNIELEMAVTGVTLVASSVVAGGVGFECLAAGEEEIVGGSRITGFDASSVGPVLNTLGVLNGQSGGGVVEGYGLIRATPPAVVEAVRSVVSGTPEVTQYSGLALGTGRTSVRTLDGFGQAVIDTGLELEIVLDVEASPDLEYLSSLQTRVVLASTSPVAFPRLTLALVDGVGEPRLAQLVVSAGRDLSARMNVSITPCSATQGVASSTIGSGLVLCRTCPSNAVPVSAFGGVLEPLPVGRDGGGGGGVAVTNATDVLDDDPCVCQPGFWSPMVLLGRATLDQGCSPCPPGSACSGAGSLPLTRRGFARETRQISVALLVPDEVSARRNSEAAVRNTGSGTEGSSGTVSAVVFHRCPRPEGCVGYPEGCARGYKGYLCATCDEGFYSSPSADAECLECPNAGMTFGVFLVGLVLVLAVSAMFSSCVALSLTDDVLRSMARKLGSVLPAGMAEEVNEMEDALEDTVSDSEWVRSQVKHRPPRVPLALSSGLLFCQILGLLGNSSVDWPSPTKSTLQMFSGFGLNLSTLGSQCMVGSWTGNYVLQAMLPAVFMAMVAVIGMGLERCWTSSHLGLFALTARVTVLVGPLVFVPVVRATLTLFDCTRLPDGSYRLDADYGVECFSGEWFEILPVGIAATLVYVIGLPCGIGWRMYVNRHVLYSPGIRERYSNLFEKYYSRFWYGDGLATLERFLIVAISLFVSESVLSMTALLLVVFALAAAVFLRVRPYYDARHNTLELALSVILSIVLMLGFVYHSRAFESDSAETSVQVGLMVCIVIGFMFLAWALVAESYDIWVQKKRLREVIQQSQKVMPADGLHDLARARFWMLFDKLRDDFVDQDEVTALAWIRSGTIGTGISLSSDGGGDAWHRSAVASSWHRKGVTPRAKSQLMVTDLFASRVSRDASAGSSSSGADDDDDDDESWVTYVEGSTTVDTGSTTGTGGSVGMMTGLFFEETSSGGGSSGSSTYSSSKTSASV